MALRLIELTLGGGADPAALAATLEGVSVVDHWQSERGARLHHKILGHAQDAEVLVDRWATRYAEDEDFRVVLLAVEATEPPPAEAEPEIETPAPRRPARVSREELYEDLGEAIEPGLQYVVLVVLSTLVAAVGLTGDNVAVVIGAMVIAPLLGPNVALAFGATLGDLAFVRRALLSNGLGLAVAFGVAFAAGVMLDADPATGEIARRVVVDLPDVVLALAAGVAGTLAMTSGVAASLIGVMVAVALLPPLVVAAMLFGAGHTASASGALGLLAANVICVNLAGVATFSALGLRPREWWERDGARRSSRLAMLLWAVLLLALLALILRAGN